MTDINNDPPAAPQVQDKRSRPSGLLPRNTQTWLIIGVAVLMAVIIAFFGPNPPKEKRPSTAVQAQSVVDPNASRIQSYQHGIDEQARKLQFEQAELARAQKALGISPETPVGASTPYSGPISPGYAAPGEPRYSPEPGREEGSLESDMRKRAYQSLFASNIAVSYRKEILAGANLASAASSNGISAVPAYPGPAEAPMGFAAPGAMTQLPFLAFGATPTGALPVGAPPQAAKGVSERQALATHEEGGEAAGTKGRQRDAEVDRAEGKRYRLFEGTVFETVLTNRLDGSFSGPVNCMMTTNVYSHDGQHLLIPQGSRLLGEVRKVDTFGQQRLAVVFHRLIMPDGYSLSLDKFHGLNQIGETGLQDQINHHYLQIFGVSLAIGAVAGLSQANTNYGLNESAADAYRQGVSSSLSQTSLHILDRYLNVLPTFTIREGQRVKVYLSDDLLLPAYVQHEVPSDL